MYSQSHSDTPRPLVSVVLVSRGTPHQRQVTQESIRRLPEDVVEVIEPSFREKSRQLISGAAYRMNPRHCRGEYILFLEPGDTLLPAFADELPRLLKDHPGMVLLSTCCDEACHHIQLPVRGAIWSLQMGQTELLRNMTFTPCHKLIRRSLLSRRESAMSMLLRALVFGEHYLVEEMPLICHPVKAGDAGGSLWEFQQKASACAHTIRKRLDHLSQEQRSWLGSLMLERLIEEGRYGIAPESKCSRSLRKRVLNLYSRRLRPFIDKMGMEGARYRAAEKAEQRETVRRQQEGMEAKVQALRTKELIHVLFIAISPACWKSDSLMKALMAHPRFRPTILVAPEMQLPSAGERRRQMDTTRRFMEARGYPVIELCDEEGENLSRIPEEYDILLYPKSYEGIVPAGLDYTQYRDRLWIYVVYGFHSPVRSVFYTSEYQQGAWIECYENEACAAISRPYKHMRDNILISGLPFSDLFLSPEPQESSPWKPQPEGVRKVIWAPHWTIDPNSILHLSSFLQLAEGMEELARQTKGRIQWAFKPHPLLYNTLCNFPGWGQERTDAYYEQWARGENTQLETGDYISLFLDSDAMVHDCCSFCCEYHLTGHPVLYVARDLDAHKLGINAMAQEAIDAQYIGEGMEDVERFIRETVLGGQDPMRPDREAFCQKYLVPPHGGNAAENIIRFILTGQL